MLAAAAPADAQNMCAFFLVDHSDSSNNLGLWLGLQSSNTGPDVCALDSVSLVLGVGDGKTFNYAVASPVWQLGHAYEATVVISGGAEQMFLDGQPVSTAAGAFQPAQTPVLASELLPWDNGQATYMVSETGAQITSGSQTIVLPSTGSYVAPPTPDILLGGPPLWDAFFTEDPTQTVTITASFAFTNAVGNAQDYNPYIDVFGQSNYGSWSSKVLSVNDLQNAIGTEQSWLSDNPPFGSLDIYGGSMVAGWQDEATGYYHTAFRNNRWWLISPLGNPTFYISLDTVGTGVSTPVTGRESEFAQLPPNSGLTAAAYSQGYWGNDADITYVFFSVANLIGKYGSDYQATWNRLIQQRLASWGFQGAGKWTYFMPQTPTTQVLYRTAVAGVVPGGHPDTFNTSVVAQLQASFASQIGANATNPFVVGWSVGNEAEEDIQPAEIQAILGLDASTPAKQALVNDALTGIYGGNVAALAQAWGISASTAAEVYNASPTPPAQDIETLRQFFEQNYYQTLYQTVKGLDPNHLYLGNWVNPPSNWVNSTDWTIIAANTDVIGFDYYAYQFDTPAMNALMAGSNKPVMVGEFSFPPNYDGQRGFGSNWISMESEAEAGTFYAQWMQAASACAYCVGVSWFEYQDEAVSGRGLTSGMNNGAALVYGEDYAFGLVDVADQPKYQLIDAVRAANLAALQDLGLLEASPAVSAGAVVNAASYQGGSIAPGEIVALFVSHAGPAALAGAQLDVSGKVATSTGDTRVLFNGIPAPMIYAVSGQLAAVAPYELAGQATALVQVEYQGIPSAAVSLPVVDAIPAVFTADSSGKGQAALRNQDFSLNSAANPAAVGSYCVLYATGVGPTNPQSVDGQLAAAAGTAGDPLPAAKVTVLVGGLPANVTYAAGAPGFVAGFVQINFQIPAGVAAGSAVPVVVSVGNVAAPAVTLAVR